MTDITLIQQLSAMYDELTRSCSPPREDVSTSVTTAIWFFLDDEREPPVRSDRHWVIFRNGESMLASIERFGMPDGISFDHDLGETFMSGHEAAKHLVEMWLDGNLVVPHGFEYVVHSQNPIGEKNITSTMDDLIKLKNGLLS